MMEAVWFKGVGFRAPMTRSTLTEHGVSSRGTFHRTLVCPAGRQTVHLGANGERLLATGITGRFSAPGIERILLQRPTVAERQPPRQGTRGMHQAQMLGRLHRALAPRQERNTGDGRGYLALQCAHRGFSHLLGAGLLPALFARYDHVRLQDHALEEY